MNELFLKAFEDYVYPTQSADELINAMTEEEQQEYFLEAKRIANSPVLERELRSLERDIIKKLAFNIHLQEESALIDVAYYRGAALFIKMFQERLNLLAAHQDEGLNLLKPVEEVSPYLGKVET